MAEKHLYADFRNFLFLVWKHLQLPDPTPIQYDIAHWLQHGPRRQVDEAFRGIGKSWITSAFVCWTLLLDPQHKFMVVSASKERADSFSTFTLRLISEMPELRHLTPRDSQRTSKIAFDVGPALADHSPSVKSVGITGQLTGSRANTIIADDVEVPGNSATQGQRDKLKELVKEFDAILKPGGRVIYLGTPQTEQSLYNELEERGYVIRIWPALYPTDKQVDEYGSRLAPYILDQLARGARAGASTDPKRFDDEDLRERAVSYGKAGFALQFMLDTKLSDQDRYPLKLSDLVVMDLNPDVAPIKIVWAAGPDQRIQELPCVGLTGDRYNRPMWIDKEFSNYTGSLMFIDPAGRGKDETSYAIIKFLHGYLFLHGCGGFLDGYADATLKGLAALAQRHKVNLIKTEANYGDGMFTKLLQPVVHAVHPCLIEEVKNTGMKEARIIDTLEPVLATHRLIVDPKVIRQDYDSVQSGDYNLERQHHYRLFHQMTRITKARGALGQDDRLDALSGAVAHFTEFMARDANKAAADHIEELRKRELERFVAQFHKGQKNRGPTWVRPRGR